MLAFAYDIDPYRAWARVAIDGCFDGPWTRKYAVGTIFLRGQGDGFVARVDGRLPQVGAARSVTYTGDGYITVRHTETQAVEEALDFIARTIRITYSQPESPALSSEAIREQWGQRLHHFDRQLNRPVWENDSLPAIGKA